jgi:hypothetical protein
MTRSRLPASLLFLALALLAADASAQQKYPIRMDRLRQVGQTYGVETVLNVSEKMSATSKGKEMGSEDKSYVVRFVADAEVTAVDKRTRYPEITYTVRRCMRYEEEDSTEMAPPGTKLLYTRNAAGGELQMLNGNEEDVWMATLRDVIIEVGVGAPDSEIGTPDPKPVGGTWSIAGHNLVKSFSEVNDLKLPKNAVKGKATLISVTESGPIPSMKVDMDIDVKKFKIPGFESFKLSKSEGAINLQCEYPLDADKLPLGAVLTLDFAIKGSGKPEPGGPVVDFDMHMVRRSTTTYSY